MLINYDRLKQQETAEYCYSIIETDARQPPPFCLRIYLGNIDFRRSPSQPDRFDVIILILLLKCFNYFSSTAWVLFERNEISFNLLLIMEIFSIY